MAFLQDMQGGELTVAGSDMDPEEHVQPETNLLVRFRGNATHRLGFCQRMKCCRSLH